MLIDELRKTWVKAFGSVLVLIAIAADHGMDKLMDTGLM